MTKKANRAFFATWTPDMAYVFGYWFADGWMSQPHTDLFVGIVSRDLEHLQRIRQVMGAEQKIYARRDGCYQLAVGSKQMWQDLRRLGGVPAKSWATECPTSHHLFCDISHAGTWMVMVGCTGTHCMPPQK